MSDNLSEHYRGLEQMYLSANINQQFFQSVNISISDKRCELSLEIGDKYFHALGALHGSVSFKMLDDAAFFAVNSIVTDVFVLTSSFNIHLLRPVSEGKITAVGELRSFTKNLFVAEASLVNDKGREVAFGTGNFMKSRVSLKDISGYKTVRN